MHKTLEELSQALNTLSTLIISGYPHETPLSQTLGWNHPSLTKRDLAYLASEIADDIRNADLSKINTEEENTIKLLISQIAAFQVNTFPQLFNGNGIYAIPAYTSTMIGIKAKIAPIIGWQSIKDTSLMPARIAKKLRSVSDAINHIDTEKESLNERIHLIQEATDAAEALPTDMEALRAASKEVNNILAQINVVNAQIVEKSQEALNSTSEIYSYNNQAQKLVTQCEEAYKITTTHGLAGSFDQRANELKNSMWAWAIALLLSLSTATYLGFERIGSLSATLANQHPVWGIIWLNIILSILTVGAPLWLAWLSTKQIGQRFKLAEDYAFKASVAKAYEGYKKEAARIDEAFEAQLFASALARFDEAPLRLVDEATHGSPWHEFFNSKPFRSALDNLPDLRETFTNVMKIPKTKNE